MTWPELRVRHLIHMNVDGGGRKGAPETLKKEPTMSFISEICSFLLARKKFWLLPIVVAMVMLGGLVVLTQGSAVAPFIYTLF